MIYEGSTPTWGPRIEITDTSPWLIYAHAATKLHLTPYAVVHLLKRHGNSRSEISNVSISNGNQSKVNLMPLLIGHYIARNY